MSNEDQVGAERQQVGMCRVITGSSIRVRCSDIKPPNGAASRGLGFGRNLRTCPLSLDNTALATTASRLGGFDAAEGQELECPPVSRRGENGIALTLLRRGSDRKPLVRSS